MLARWSQVLDDLADDPAAAAPASSTGSPSGRSSRATARATGSTWSDARLQLVDLQYSDVRPDKGLYHRLVARGRMERILTDDEIGRRGAPAARGHPRLVPRASASAATEPSVAAASWDSVIFDVPGRASLQRVPMLEPLRGTRAHVGALLDRCATAADLVDASTTSSTDRAPARTTDRRHGVQTAPRQVDPTRVGLKR